MSSCTFYGLQGLRRFGAIMLGVSLGSFLGCDPGSSAPEKVLSQLKIQNASNEPMSIADVIDQCRESDEPVRALIRAKIGSGKGETFDRAKCVFLISDIPKGEHSAKEGHDEDNCPFCRQREAMAPTTTVTLTLPKGVREQAADRLLGLKKGQHILLEGEVTYLSDLNFVNIEASGLEIR
jgi:hypothetical protein